MSNPAFIQFQQQEKILDEGVSTQENQQIPINGPKLIKDEYKFQPPLTYINQGILEGIVSVEGQQNNTTLITEHIKLEQNLHTTLIIKKEEIDQTSNEKIHKCNICDKKFTRRSGLFQHKQIHTGEKPFVCDVCNKKFNQRHNMIKHKKIHSGEKPFVCDICDKSFIERRDLSTHQRTHTGEKPHLCDFCNKVFSQRSSLVQHKKIHTEEKSFLCDVCKKTFRTQNRLVEHKRIHTGDKPFICNFCDKGFSRSSGLIQHKRYHTGEKPFSCNICDKAFSNSSNLIQHKQIHTGEKPFSCNICDKAFNNVSNLIQHKQIHTGEKPFSCNICDKAFNNASNLIQHKRIHFKEKPSAQEQNLSKDNQSHFKNGIKIEKQVEPELIFIKQEIVEEIVPNETVEDIAMQLLDEGVTTQGNQQINMNGSILIKDEQKKTKIEEYFDPEFHFKEKPSAQEQNLSKDNQSHFENGIKIEKQVEPELIFIKQEIVEEIVPKETVEDIAMQLLDEGVTTHGNQQINMNESILIKDEQKKTKIE